jgi:histone H3/H4
MPKTSKPTKPTKPTKPGKHTVIDPPRSDGDVTPLRKKPHFSNETRAKRAVAKEQKRSCELAIPRAVFKRCAVDARNKVARYANRFESDAVTALQQAAEAFVIQWFQAGDVVRRCSGTKTGKRVPKILLLRHLHAVNGVGRIMAPQVSAFWPDTPPIPRAPPTVRDPDAKPKPKPKVAKVAKVPKEPKVAKVPKPAEKSPKSPKTPKSKATQPSVAAKAAEKPEKTQKTPKQQKTQKTQKKAPETPQKAPKKPTKKVPEPEMASQSSASASASSSEEEEEEEVEQPVPRTEKTVRAKSKAKADVKPKLSDAQAMPPPTAKASAHNLKGISPPPLTIDARQRAEQEKYRLARMERAQSGRAEQRRQESEAAQSQLREFEGGVRQLVGLQSPARFY